MRNVGSKQLALHAALSIQNDGGEIGVGIVWDAAGADDLDKLDGGIGGGGRLSQPSSEQLAVLIAARSVKGRVCLCEWTVYLV